MWLYMKYSEQEQVYETHADFKLRTTAKELILMQDKNI